MLSNLVSVYKNKSSRTCYQLQNMLRICNYYVRKINQVIQCCYIWPCIIWLQYWYWLSKFNRELINVWRKRNLKKWNYNVINVLITKFIIFHWLPLKNNLNNIFNIIILDFSTHFDNMNAIENLSYSPCIFFLREEDLTINFSPLPK